MLCYMIDKARYNKINNGGKFVLEFKDINDVARWFVNSKFSGINCRYLNKGICLDSHKMQEVYGKPFYWALVTKIDILARRAGKYEYY